MYNFIKQIAEGKTPKTLERIKLPYALDGLGRSLSKRAVNYHYGKLYKAYCDRFNAGEGDLDFNEAGAFLHAKYFSQFTNPKNNNVPTGASLDFIEQHYKGFEDFKEKFLKRIQKYSFYILFQRPSLTIINKHLKNAKFV